MKKEMLNITYVEAAGCFNWRKIAFYQNWQKPHSNSIESNLSKNRGL